MLVSSPPTPAFKQIFKFVSGTDRDPGRTFHAGIDILSYAGYSFFGPSPLEGELNMMGAVPNVQFSGPEQVPDQESVKETFRKLSEYRPMTQGGPNAGFAIPDEFKKWIVTFIIDLISKLFTNNNPSPMPT